MKSISICSILVMQKTLYWEQQILKHDYPYIHIMNEQNFEDSIVEVEAMRGNS